MIAVLGVLLTVYIIVAVVAGAGLVLYADGSRGTYARAVATAILWPIVGLVFVLAAIGDGWRLVRRWLHRPRTNGL